MDTVLPESSGDANSGNTRTGTNSGLVLDACLVARPIKTATDKESWQVSRPPTPRYLGRKVQKSKGGGGGGVSFSSLFATSAHLMQALGQSPAHRKARRVDVRFYIPDTSKQKFSQQTP